MAKINKKHPEQKENEYFVGDIQTSYKKTKAIKWQTCRFGDTDIETDSAPLFISEDEARDAGYSIDKTNTYDGTVQALGDAYIGVRYELSRRGFAIAMLFEKHPELVKEAFNGANAMLSDSVNGELIPVDTLPQELKNK